MKPNFALNLTHTGVSLLQRATGGWSEVGTVSFETPTLGEALSALRETAQGSTTDALCTKLVLPNSQILYRTFDDPGGRTAKREAVIREALVGATPYAVEELVFDWRAASDGLHVAVVAKETLQEAEDFAAEHGFNPISFVANPENTPFSGEAFFGRTQAADALIGKRTRVEPDADRIEIVEPDPTQLAPDPVSDPQPQNNTAAPENEADPAHERHENAEILPEPQTPAPAASVEAPSVGFSSRRQPPAQHSSPAPHVNPVPPTSKPAQSRLAAVPSRLASLQAAPSATKAAPQHPHVPMASSSLEPPIEAQPSKTAKKRTALASPSVLPEPPAMPSSHTTPPRNTEFSAAAFNDTSSEAPDELRPMSSAQTGLIPQIEDEPATDKTVFGSLKPIGTKPQSTGRVRLALAIMLGATVALAALWGPVSDKLASYRDVPSSEGAQDLDPTQSVADTASPSAPHSEAALQNAPLPQERPEPELAPQPATSQIGTDLPPVDTITARAAPIDLDTIQRMYVATGIWPLAPDTGIDDPARTHGDSEDLGTLYIASIDPQIASQDAVALPNTDAYRSHSLPNLQSAPVPADTTFDFDERGLVRATPQGALTPTGIRVFSGRPVQTVRTRPERTEVPEVEAVDPVRVALAQITPSLRPSGLIERNEQATFGGLTRVELGAFLPKERPASAQQDAAAEAAARAEATGEDAPARTAPVVTASALPQVRPKDFDKLTQAAQAAAQAASKPAPDAATTNNSAANRVTASVPRTSIPSSTAATVARAATVPKAINLRKVNLMGVYGAKSDRRALVRLGSGRLSKVKVGDRVDGGRVQSISESALVYVKSGRSITLQVGG